MSGYQFSNISAHLQQYPESLDRELFTHVLRSFKDEMDWVGEEKIEDMWGILAQAEGEQGEKRMVVHKDSVVGLVEMMVEDYQQKKESQKQKSMSSNPYALQPQTKSRSHDRAFSNSEILEILRSIFQQCFRIVPNYEVSLGELEKVVQSFYPSESHSVMGMLKKLLNQKTTITSIDLEELISFYEEQEIFDTNLGETEGGFHSNAPLGGMASGGLKASSFMSSHLNQSGISGKNYSGGANNSFSDSLLEISSSQSSLSPRRPNQNTQKGFGGDNGNGIKLFREDEMHHSPALHTSPDTSFEKFDKFIIKFNIVASDIDSLHRHHPEVVSQATVDKLAMLKKDSSVLTQNLKKKHELSENQIKELETLCQTLQSQVFSLREEVEWNVNMNQKLSEQVKEMQQKELSQSTSYNDSKYSSGAYFEIEERNEHLLKENVTLKTHLESSKKENQKIIQESDFVREKLDELQKNYDEVFHEKLTLEAEVKAGKESQTTSNQMTTELKTLRHKSTKLEADLQEADDTNEKLEQYILDLKSQIKELKENQNNSTIQTEDLNQSKFNLSGFLAPLAPPTLEPISSRHDEISLSVENTTSLTVKAPEKRPLIEQPFEGLNLKGKEKVIGEVSVGKWEEIGSAKKEVREKANDAKEIEPEYKETIKEVIKEVVVEKTISVPVEASIPQIEKMTVSTSTPEPIKPTYSINSIAQFQCNERIFHTNSTQTEKTPLEMELNTVTLKIPGMPPREALSSPLTPQTKLYSFSFNNLGSPKISRGSETSTPGTPSSTNSQDVVKLQNRIKIYQDKNVQLAMELDQLKNQHSGLYSKLSGKTFESNSAHQQKIDSLKKQIQAMEAQSAKDKKLQEEVAARLYKEHQDSLILLKKQKEASEKEASNLKIEHTLLSKKLHELEFKKENMRSISLMTDLVKVPQNPQKTAVASAIDASTKQKLKGILNKKSQNEPTMMKAAKAQEISAEPQKAHKTAKSENREDLDFLRLRFNNSIRRMLMGQSEIIDQNSTIFSDDAIRINSRQQRKVRVVFVTTDNFYVLVPTNSSEYKIKTVLSMQSIHTVDVAQNNSLMINIRTKENRATEFLEVFKRNKLLLFLKAHTKCTFKRVQKIFFSSMKGKDIEYDLQRSSFVKPEIQGMLDKATKIGLLKIEKNGKESQESRLCVLTDMGLLVLQVDNFSVLDFISLAHCNCQANSAESEGNPHYLELTYSNCSTVYRLRFDNVSKYGDWIPILGNIADHQK